LSTQVNSANSKIVLKLVAFSVPAAPHQPQGALRAAPCWLFALTNNPLPSEK